MNEKYNVEMNSDKLALIEFAKFGIACLKDKNLTDEEIISFLKNSFGFSENMIEQII
jgi:hypothetical protein